MDGKGKADDIRSPCNKICTIDRASGLCRGCLRTIAEIRDWSRMSPGERRGLLADLAGRSLETRPEGG